MQEEKKMKNSHQFYNLDYEVVISHRTNGPKIFNFLFLIY